MTTQCVRLIRSRQPIRSVRITSSFGENENAAAEMAAASANQGPSPEELEQARLQQEADRSFLQTVMQDIAESIEELEQRRAQSLEELQQGCRDARHPCDRRDPRPTTGGRRIPD